MTHGLLLINLGTPDSPQISSVKRYLREFLSDKRVIDLPWPLRYSLVYGLIIPLRAKASTHAYQAIWTKEGSPLLIHSQNLVSKLKERLSSHYSIVLGMRYGQPSITQALEQLADCSQLSILPLYPQYSSAASGSSIEKVLQWLAKRNKHPKLKIYSDFHQHPAFIKAKAELIAPFLSRHEYLLFSFHGIPERHLHATGCDNICQDACPALAPYGCYKAQSYQTSRELAKLLKISPQDYGVSFQSRLGKTPWIKPYTDEFLRQLREKGIKRLAIACPSFTADCLETLEEIGIRAKDQWLQLGGEVLSLIPCLNDSDAWVKAIVEILELEPQPIIASSV